MRECKTPNVPSFSALCKLQQSLTREVGIKSEHHTSSLGNHFYMNHPAKLLALDWANLLVRPFIHLYPEVSGPVSESWHAEKWTTEIDLNELVPMWADWKNKSTCHRHFYVNELARQHDGTYVVPIRWITVNGIVHADVQDVELIHRQALELSEARSWLIFCLKTGESPAYDMPHPLREKAQGRPMFRLRIMPWSDNVSGNVSKQYNAHTNVYVTNLNLPHQKLQQEYFIRFASTSPRHPPSNFIPGRWHEAYDCELEQDILFEIIPHVLPADNPQQSETSSHIGMAGSLGCRCDFMGGTKEYCETDEGYAAFYVPGEPRNVWMACLGNKTAVDASYTSTGVKDKIAQHWISALLEKAKLAHHEHLSDKTTREPELNNSRCKGDERNTAFSKNCGIGLCNSPTNSYCFRQMIVPLKLTLDLKPGVHYNVLLQTRDSGLDPHHDTPGEILHTYLLGNNNRLQASSISGLSIPPPRPRYVVQYKNSLIGKHFKMLQQLGVFYLHDLVSPLIFDLWKATRELGAHLWCPEIKNMGLYVADLRVLINNLLDIWGLIDPNRILVKGKLHTLVHLPDDVPRFGPSILYSTEIFECWNAIFRLCSILSNHISPSHDIATTLADMERFKHMASGGWWKTSDGQYVRGGSRVRSFLTSNRECQRRLKWSEKTKLKSGMSCLNPPAMWKSSLSEPNPVDSTWVSCKYVSTQAGDLCKPGHWAFIQRNTEHEPFPARITQILARDGSTLTQHNNVVVIVEPFVVLDTKDEQLNMPVLVPSIEAMTVNPGDILLSFNAQHDCVRCQCKADTVPIQQEPDSRFILNMHALHNAHLIREVLPRSLVAPVPYLRDRAATHIQFAEKLRETGPARRAKIHAKMKDTQARNKEGKVGLAAAQAQRQQDEQDRRAGIDNDVTMDED
ncbi:hypothetical protein DFH06DRAFT_1272024 [Mycena polygramma]|nr:hypothetical protein DFH06DRAFT_1272024 [Mycena polygramma]